MGGVGGVRGREGGREGERESSLQHHIGSRDSGCVEIVIAPCRDLSCYDLDKPHKQAKTANNTRPSLHRQTPSPSGA